MPFGGGGPTRGPGGHAPDDSDMGWCLSRAMTAAGSFEPFPGGLGWGGGEPGERGESCGGQWGGCGDSGSTGESSAEEFSSWISRAPGGGSAWEEQVTARETRAYLAAHCRGNSASPA